MQLDDDDEIRIGPVSKDEREKMQQQQRRRTLLELPTPVSQRVLSMSSKSQLLATEPDKSVKESLPRKTFEFLNCEDDDLDEVRIGPLSEEELAKRQHQERRRTLLELPSPVSKRIQSMTAADCASLAVEESLAQPSPLLAVLVSPTRPGKAAVTHVATRSQGAARERALRLATLLAERAEILKTGGSCCSVPSVEPWKAALPHLSDDQRARVSKMLLA